MDFSKLETNVIIIYINFLRLFVVVDKDVKMGDKYLSSVIVINTSINQLECKYH